MAHAQLPPLTGYALTQVCFDAGGVVLRLSSSEREAEVRIEAEADWRTSGPGVGDGSAAGDVLQLLSLPIERVSLAPSGALDLAWPEDRHLTIKPDLEYESWSLDVDMQQWIGLPGGAVAHWDRSSVE